MRSSHDGLHRLTDVEPLPDGQRSSCDTEVGESSTGNEVENTEHLVRHSSGSIYHAKNHHIINTFFADFKPSVYSHDHIIELLAAAGLLRIIEDNAS